MYSRIVVALSLMLTSTIALGKEVAGVTLPETVTLGAKPLMLNGAGIRTKFFVKVYVGALDLPARTRDTEAVLHSNGPVAMHMYFLHSEVSKEKLVDAWNEGFDANLDAAERARLGPRIERFNALFYTMHKGDVMRLDYLPGAGTTVSIDNEKRGVIEGEDFMHAWLRIWLGQHPADPDLKQSLLGTD
ncbi:MAG TPA: chalcone isomerase family protein [Candidatus Methylomirabilis sp.]|nr:chalcone isomerase family protein [Candidatus Methylomirabilis sp.]